MKTKLKDKIKAGLKKFGSNVLTSVTDSHPVIGTVVNVAVKLIGKKPIKNMADPIEDTKKQTTTPEGKTDKTKSTLVILVSLLSLNAVTSHYFGISLVPESIKTLILEYVISLFQVIA